MAASDDTIRLNLQVVTDAGTRKTLEELSRVRKEIDALTKEFKDGKKDVDTFNKELAELEKQAKKLDAALDQVGEKRRIDIESGDLDEPGAKAGTRLRAAGRELRNLPSVQIPGAGIGTDAIGNITRMVGALAGVTEQSKVVTTASKLLTPVLGAQAAATVGAYAPMALLVSGLLVAGKALSAFVDNTSRNADKINALAEGQRDLNKRIVDGLSSEEARAELERLTEAQKRNKEQLTTLKGEYDSSQQQLGNFASGFNTALNTLSGGSLAATKGINTLGDVTKALSGDEEALAGQITAANSTIIDQQTQMDLLKLALEDGSLAANDAAEAEKKLAEERTKAVLDQAQSAGQEEAARRRALDATEAQNLARLDSIEDEKAAIQAQLDVLQSSGDTSEEVTAQIEKLNGSLGSLGKEADFINNTALEASKKRDAEKKAAKDAEEAAKKAEQAQQKYNDAVKNAGRSLKQGTEDIKHRLKEGLADNLTSLLEDATDIATKYQRGTADLDLKAQRAERDALLEHHRSIEDIQDDALKTREEALRAGDFKQAFLAQQSGEDALKKEQLQINRKEQDRARALSDERSDLLTNAQRERADRLLAYDRQNADTRLAADRSINEAKLNHSRALALAKENQAQDLANLDGHLQRMTARYTQFFSGIEGMMNGMIPGSRTATGRQSAARPQTAGSLLTQIMQR